VAGLGKGSGRKGAGSTLVRRAHHPTPEPSFRIPSPLHPCRGIGDAIVIAGDALTTALDSAKSLFVPRKPSAAARLHATDFAPSGAWVPAPLLGSGACQHELDLVVRKALDEGALSLDDYLLEQFIRASSYFDSASSHIADHLTRSLERLREAAFLKSGRQAGGWEAALFVQEVTKIDHQWSSYKMRNAERLLSPAVVVADLLACPDGARLQTIGEALTYSRQEWKAVFCQLGGVFLLVHTLATHLQTVKASRGWGLMGRGSEAGWMGLGLACALAHRPNPSTRNP